MRLHPGAEMVWSAAPRIYPYRVYSSAIQIPPGRIWSQSLALEGADDGTPFSAPLVGAARARRRAVHGHHGHLDHRGRPPRHAGRSRLLAGQPLVGLQRLRDRLRRPAVARRTPVRPARPSTGLRRGLGRPRRRLCARRPGRHHQRRDHCSCDPGRWLGVDRTVRAHAADDALRRRAARARQGHGRLRRRGTRRRHCGRVPRRRAHRVGRLAVGLLREHPGRPRRPARCSRRAPADRRPARLDRRHRRARRHRWSRAHGARHRPCAPGGLDLAPRRSSPSPPARS